MAHAPLIALFDSGLGGLSVLNHIRRALPEAAVVAVADGAAFPYGDLPEEEVIHRVTAVLARLETEGPPDLAVIACNTASTVVLDALRARFAFPIVGCVPPVKPAGTVPGKRAIGLLATPATVKRTYTDALIRDFAGSSEVIRLGAPNLARLAERAMRGHVPSPADIRAEVAEFFDRDGTCLVDRVVLGCTHYPLLLDQLKAALPGDVAWFDSGEAIARRVSHLLADRPKASSPTTHSLAHRMLFTLESDEIDSLRPFLLASGFRTSGLLTFPRGADQAGPIARLAAL